MPLPTITTSEYELVLPSNGKTVKYRPFLVKEDTYTCSRRTKSKRDHKRRKTSHKSLCNHKGCQN